MFNLLDSEKLISKIFIDNPWTALVIFVLAIFGLTSTFILYFKGLKRRIPKIEMRSNNLINNFANKYNGLKISFNSENIENLTSTKLCFWNAGRETINRGDIATTDKVKIDINSEYKILDVKIIKIVNSANRFSIIESDDGKYFIDFEYLDKNEGVVIQLIHTGKSSSDILLTGSIKSYGSLTGAQVKLPIILASLHFFNQIMSKIMEKILNYFYKDEEEVQNRKKYYTRKIVGMFTLIIPIVITLEKFSPNKGIQRLSLFEAILLILMFLMYYSLGYFLLKRKIPKKLDIY